MPLDAIRGRIPDQFSIENIGANLLRNLAEGLYTPAEVIREYVQNAVDAHRLWEYQHTGTLPIQPVQIEILNDDLHIIDYGIGMDEAGVRSVKDISMSSKPLFDVDLTGHKGVGIWAGLSYFDQLVLYTSMLNSTRGYKLTLFFKEMAELIRSSAVHTLHIGNVLNPNFLIEDYDEEPERHGTTVVLRSPSRSSEFFLDASLVTNAVRERCPCEIDETFHLAKQVQGFYAEHGIRTFPITVNGDSVRRSFPGNVTDFKVDSIKVNEQPVCVVWHAIHDSNGILTAKGNQLVGFRLYQTGFQIGEQNPYSKQNLQEYAPIKVQETYPNWYIGECHIVSRALTPNLPRKDFEESEDTRQFITAFRKWWVNLDANTRLLADKRNLKDSYDRFEQKLREAETTVDEVVAGRDGIPAMRAEVAGIVAALREDDAQVQNRKARSASSPPPSKVEARRLLTNDRRRLLHLAESLLTKLGEPAPEPGDGACPPTESKTQGTGSDESASDSEQSATTYEPPPSTAPSSPRDASDTQPSLFVTVLTPEQSDEVPVQVSFDLIVGLLEEILAETFADESKVASVLDVLQSRLQNVLSNG